MPWNGPNAPMPPPRPGNPPTATSPVSAAPSAANPTASSGGAAGALSSSNPRFVQLDQGQNIDPTNRRGGPQMTALNLGGLFGGGGKPQAPDFSNVPDDTFDQGGANGGRIKGPLAKRGGSSAPWGMGPLQKGMVFPSAMGPRRPSSSVDPALWGG
jgi:hypothetical protein